VEVERRDCRLLAICNIKYICVHIHADNKLQVDSRFPVSEFQI
jgi:hypothetical protein